MRRSRSWLLVASLVLAVGCDPSAGWMDPEEDFTSEAALNRTVWITVGNEALEPLRSALQANQISNALSPADSNATVSAVSVRERDIPLVSAVMHEKLNRCGGFMVHASQAAAVASLKQTAPESLAAAVTYTVDNAVAVNPMIAELSDAALLGTITKLSAFPTRYYTSQTGVDAANWLKSLWTGYAGTRTDVKVELFKHSAWAQPSVIATITGASLPNEVVVLGGHLDSINLSGGNAPGADDDASGIATISEAFRAAMKLGYRPARTVKFIGYAAEEVGLRGSKEIAQKFKADGVNVVGVLQLDMTDFKGSAVDITLVTDWTSAAQNAFVVKLIDTYVKVTHANIQCGYACSDHASWTNAGYPSSTPFEALMEEYNPKIHSTGDTLAQLGNNVVHAMKFAKLASAYLGELAKGTVTSSGPGPVTATYDATLKVPKCAKVGSSCTSGALLTGRGALGPEKNAPNTIGSRCGDGSQGTFHDDESVDRIRVASADGGAIAVGKKLRVEATVWAYGDGSQDAVDLYTAPDATAVPLQWTFLATLTPSSGGARVVTTAFTLPPGSLQVVRARIRFGGTAAPCGTGPYVDHDDLVFAVASQP